MKLLREMYEGYAESVGLAPRVHYLHGTPLRPVVPLDTGTSGVFVLGAYPSARFALIDGISDVPVADNLGPFESERWFDGASIRKQPSAHELQTLFLEPLNLARPSCWITDLVKVFLFKPGHIERYRKLGVPYPVGYERERFGELGLASMYWIKRELEAARPRLLITLGAEVAGVVRCVSPGSAQVKLLVPRIETLQIGGTEVATIHCAHPGILMRPAVRNRWPSAHCEEFLPVMKEFLGRQAKVAAATGKLPA